MALICERQSPQWEGWWWWGGRGWWCLDRLMTQKNKLVENRSADTVTAGRRTTKHNLREQLVNIWLDN